MKADFPKIRLRNKTATGANSERKEEDSKSTVASLKNLHSRRPLLEFVTSVEGTSWPGRKA